MEATHNSFYFSYSYDHIRETLDLLTLVNQSYEALNIGKLDSIEELQSAIEHVDAVKMKALEKQLPEDTESLGIASTLGATEEIETFERMVSFFHKKKPVENIPWDIFTLKQGRFSVKDKPGIYRRRS